MSEEGTPGADGAPIRCLEDVWDRREVFETPEGRSIILTPRPTILYARVEGHMDSTMWPHIPQGGNPLMDAGHTIQIFCDWDPMTGYVTEARSELTRWVLGRYKSIERIHFTIASRVVQMGVLMAGTVIRTFKMHRDRTNFEAELEAAVARWDEEGGSSGGG